MNKIDFSTKRVNLIIVLLSAVLMLMVLNFPFKANPLGDITFHAESKNTKVINIYDKTNSINF